MAATEEENAHVRGREGPTRLVITKTQPGAATPAIGCGSMKSESKDSTVLKAPPTEEAKIAGMQASPGVQNATNVTKRATLLESAQRISAVTTDVVATDGMSIQKTEEMTITVAEGGVTKVTGELCVCRVPD